MGLPAVKVLVLVFIAGVVVKTLSEGLPTAKAKLLHVMKDSYSKWEVVDLLHQMKLQHMMLFLIYGIIAGVFLASF